MFCHCVRNWQTLEILAGLLWFSPVCANDNEPFAISLLPNAARMVNEACISLVTVVAICPLGHLSFWPEVTSHCQWQWIRTGSLSDRKNLHRLVCLLHNVPSECRFATPEVRKVITYLYPFSLDVCTQARLTSPGGISSSMRRGRESMRLGQHGRFLQGEV